MRLRTALLIFAALNVLWAAAFFGYAHRSTTPVVHGDLPRLEAPLQPAVTTPASNRPAVSNAAVAQNTQPAPAQPTPNTSVTNTNALVRAARQYGWQDVTNEVYGEYIANLRAIGCPEKQIRSIIVADVNELFDKRRLEFATRSDSQWWKAETFMGVLPMNTMMTSNFDQERRELLEKLIGSGWDDGIRLPSLNASSVNLTGPVLGALPADTWNNVQEICQRSIDRHNTQIMARMNEGVQAESTDMAKLRNQTRVDLAQVLTPEQLEEFLLRYSHNSSKLRQEMRGLELTPDEFRKVFRSIDPLEHQMQLDYGGLEALSPRQREEFQAQRDRAIQEALSPERYRQYVLTKDPLFKQAQFTAMQYGLNSKAVQPLYELQRNMDTRRAQISQNAALTPEQKAQALQTLGVEHQQILQRMLGDTTFRQ